MFSMFLRVFTQIFAPIVLALFAIVFVASSCKKTSEEEVLETNTALAAQLRQRAIDDYINYYQSSTTNFAWTGDAASCAAGAVPQSIQDRVLKRINFYRRTVGLPTNISFTTLLNEKAAKTALLMQSNLRSEGSPSAVWSCYSADAVNGWTNGLRANGYTAADAVDAWMVDEQDLTGALLDRRWLLYSRAKTYGHGSADNFGLLYAKHNFNNPPTTLPLPEYIAYPPKGYIVSDLFYPNMRWSFSIPNADFRTVAVTVKNSDGSTITTTKYPVQDLEADNTFVFRPSLNYALTRDTKFSVTVANVKVNGVLKTYNYEVTWVKR
jgi:hypothetical protein